MTLLDWGKRILNDWINTMKVYRTSKSYAKRYLSRSIDRDGFSWWSWNSLIDHCTVHGRQYYAWRLRAVIDTNLARSRGLSECPTLLWWYYYLLLVVSTVSEFLDRHRSILVPMWHWSVDPRTEMISPWTDHCVGWRPTMYIGLSLLVCMMTSHRW